MVVLVGTKTKEYVKVYNNKEEVLILFLPSNVTSYSINELSLVLSGREEKYFVTLKEQKKALMKQEISKDIAYRLAAFDVDFITNIFGEEDLFEMQLVF